MKPSEIEKLAEVKEAVQVLKGLEKRGLQQPAIAGGWIRSFLTDLPPSDIDVLYVGPVHYHEAQDRLSDILAKLSINPIDWDIKGIWNAELAWQLSSVNQSILIYYVSSIDSVYLTSDGKLHDPTGHGYADALTKTLRINDYVDRPITPGSWVNTYLEGCRRIVKFGWQPTERSTELIKQGALYWEKLTEESRQKFYHRLEKKYLPRERKSARQVYEKYGWGFVFDGIVKNLS
jgi:hypothetical protein